MKYVWISLFICFFAHRGIASNCSQQAKKTCAQIVNSVGTLEKDIQPHLAYVEKNMCIIDQLLDQLEDADCEARRSVRRKSPSRHQLSVTGRKGRPQHPPEPSAKGRPCAPGYPAHLRNHHGKVNPGSGFSRPQWSGC